MVLDAITLANLRCTVKIYFPGSTGFTPESTSYHYKLERIRSAFRLALEEAALIHALKEGREDAFRCLVVDYGDRMYNTVLSIIQDTQDIEDIVQEVFMAVYQNIDKFRGDAKLSTWMYRIAVTKSLEVIRKQKRNPMGLITESMENLATSGFNHPGVLLENREKAALLFQALKRLPEAQKTAFVLHKTEGLSYLEIASVMKISLPAVESLIYRARQGLQKLLASYYKL